MQKLVRNEDGSVRSGSASNLTTEYDPSRKGLSNHRIREKRGKVISLDAAEKNGVFLLLTRGLAAYDSVSGTFEVTGKEDSRSRPSISLPNPRSILFLVISTSFSRDGTCPLKSVYFLGIKLLPRFLRTSIPWHPKPSLPWDFGYIIPLAPIALLQPRKTLLGPGISTYKLIGKTQLLMCTNKKDGTVIVEVPNKQAGFLSGAEGESTFVDKPRNVQN